MRLKRHTNGINIEFKMQDILEQWLSDNNEYREIITFREVYVKEVSRRADFLLLHSEKRGVQNRLINIEAKCNNLDSMIKQLNDHATYCDYCFAFFPDYTPTPYWIKNKLAESGYGLIIYNYDKEIITEVFEAHYNKPKDKKLRSEVIKKLNSLHRNSKITNKKIWNDEE